MRLLAIFLLVIFFLSCSDRRKVSDCQRFKKGNYFFLSGPKRVKISIARDSTQQTQYNPITDTITGYNMKWTSECEYEVFQTYTTKKHITDASQMRAFMDLENVVLVKFRIIESANDYYVFQSWKEGSSTLYSDTLWIDNRIGGFRFMHEIYNVKAQ